MVGSGLCRPGMYSSATTWKFVPPNPKALTPPRRTPSGQEAASHPRNWVLTAKGIASQSTFSLGREKLRLGVSTLCCSCLTILNRPAAPAPALRWPMLDLTEPSAMERGLAPDGLKTSARQASSAASPTRVEVPWASRAVQVAGSTPAHSQPRATANFWPAGLGAVMPLPLPSEDPPTDRMTAWMLSPSRSASASRLRMKIAAPSPMTKPSAPASNGRVPVADSAPILQNLTKASMPMLWSIPPVTTAS